MFRKLSKSIPEDNIPKTYAWEGLILPIVAGKGTRFIAVDTHEYPWRFKVIDTKYNIAIPNKESMYESIVSKSIKSLNDFADDGCTFPWEPKNA